MKSCPPVCSGQALIDADLDISITSLLSSLKMYPVPCFKGGCCFALVDVFMLLLHVGAKYFLVCRLARSSNNVQVRAPERSLSSLDGYRPPMIVFISGPFQVRSKFVPGWLQPFFIFLYK